MNKKILFLPVIMAVFLSASLSAQTDSALRTSSFDVFSTSYDFAMDELHWNNVSIPKASLFTGVNSNYLNINGAGLLGPAYLSGRFYQKITNYGDWPNNMTDLTVDVLAGFSGGWSIGGHYYDFCRPDGIGTIQPGILAGRIADLGDAKLRLSAGTTYVNLYPKSNLVDLIQLISTFKIEYGADADNCAGLSYRIINTWAGTNNTTDTGSIPVYNRISGWYGHTWNIEDNCRIGIRPNFFANFNAINRMETTSINPSGNLYNSIPGSGNFEGLIRMPLALGVKPFNDKIECVVSLMFGLYYANFDHLNAACTGGYNKAGWVPETGIGFGVNMDVNSRCHIQIGSQFIRVPVYNSSNTYSYNENASNGLTASNIFEAPLSVSINLHM